MNKEEKKRKFHDSLLKLLYPPSPPREAHQSPHHSPHDYDDELVNDQVNNLSSSSSDDDDNDNGDGDGGRQKLTRAQRKRLRKKKLRQAASQRRPIIGPLLPTTPAEDTPTGEADQGLVPVRHNAAEEHVVSGIHSSEEQGASSNQNKLKQRRIAKKLTRDMKEQKDSSNMGM